MVGPVDVQDQPEPHFVLVPLMAQGHMIPMADLALLIASHGARVSLITTPVNAVRIRAAADYATVSGLSLKLVELALPCTAGIPEGCENFDLIPRMDLFLPFSRSMCLLAEPLKSYIRAQPPAPTCIISDHCMYWTMEVANELRLPRFVFHGTSCFFMLCTLKLAKHKVYEKVTDHRESFFVPDMPQRIEVNKLTAEQFFGSPGMEDMLRHAEESERSADGLVFNTFNELEQWCVEEYGRSMGKDVWPIGPVSQFHKDIVGKTVRCNGTAGVDPGSILKWLEGRETGSVLFISFGSLARTRLRQLVEIGFGLEAAGVPFVWVMKPAEQIEKVEAWRTEFTERNIGRGLIITGWVPQVLILTNPAVGGFMTHCGWNSTLEGVAAGLPMTAWPHFSDQFLNAKLVVEVLMTGVEVGVKLPDFYLSEVAAALVGRDEVERAVVSIMGGGEKAEERRKRAKELGGKARNAMERGGSSYESLTRLIDHAVKLAGPQ